MASLWRIGWVTCSAALRIVDRVKVRTWLFISLALVCSSCERGQRQQQRQITQASHTDTVMTPEAFSISYLRVPKIEREDFGLIEPGDYLFVMITKDQTFRLTSVNMKRGFIGTSVAAAEHCPVVDGKCFSDSENFLPIIVNDKPIGDYEIPGGDLSLSKRAGVAKDCNKYTIKSKTNKAISEQIYDFCPDQGVYRITTFRAGKPTYEFILTGAMGLMH